MGYEIDFLPVGEESRCGDAIAMRYGNLHGARTEQTVVVIDGGTLESGKQLTEHVQSYYGTDVIDFAVSTHPDDDHVSGLRHLVEHTDVRTLLMHQPWEHADDMRTLFKNPNQKNLDRKLEKSIETASELEDIAQKRGIPIYQPFAGLKTEDGSLHVLGPSQEYYQNLVPNFRRTPAGLMEKLVKAVEHGVDEALEWIEETLHLSTEKLDDSGETSAENNSSVILLLTVEDHRLLFTGDAGIPALLQAADYAASQGLDLQSLQWMQVPHHGSKRNIGPSVLSRIRAPYAYISCAKKSHPKHPAQRVVNALLRREIKTYSTKGGTKCHHHNAPDRGWSNATPLEFVGRYQE